MKSHFQLTETTAKIRDRPIEVVVERQHELSRGALLDEKPGFAGRGITLMHDYVMEMPSQSFKPLKAARSRLQTFLNEFFILLAYKQAKKITVLMVVNFMCTFYLIFTATATNSMALTAFAYLTIFDLLCLGTCLLSLWTSQQLPNANYSFGFDRYEILAVFVSTTLTQLGAFFILKESVERMFQYQEVKTDGQLSAVVLGLLLHLIVIYGITNKPFSHVSSVATSNLLQEIMEDFGKNICGMAPMLSRYLLPRLNPYALLGQFSALVVLAEVVLVEQRSSSTADTVCAMIIAFFSCLTMLPLGVYSGMILLQAAPKHMMERLDKLLREANTIDGVLEIKNEHIWNVGFERIACSFQVRIRRDAIEQLILAEITHRLSPFLHHLTIQIFKDDRSITSISYGPAFSGQQAVQLTDKTNMFNFDFDNSRAFPSKSKI